MITFLLEVSLQSVVCFLGFLAGILYERDRMKRQNPRFMENTQNPAEFRAGKVWYRQTPIQDN